MSPQCEQKKEDCFAYKKGKCQCLEKDTKFRYSDGTVKPCSFYKNRGEIK